MTLYAHSTDNPDYEYQTLQEHLTNVGLLTASFLPHFDPEWGMQAGLTHDVGKASTAWQSYLMEASQNKGRKLKSPGHDFQGAVYQYQHRNIPLAFMVAGHHRGLKDFNPVHDDFNFKLELNKKENHNALADALLNHPLTYNAPKKPTWLSNTDNLQWDVFIRMGLSALVDADRLDTEAYSGRSGNNSSLNRFLARGCFPELSAYGEVLHKAIDSKSNSLTKVNHLRSLVVADCRLAAENPIGAFTLTVPTGGGKTLSSLEFATLHAAKWGHKRIIIALPYTSIIDQTADVFRTVFKELGEDVVLEHHSNVAPEKETPASKVAVENWDAPLIVTTQVQLFDSLFSNHPRECRKLHNLQDSIIILDEVQTLPVKYLTPTLSMLQELVLHYGVTLLLTTATQPELGKTEFFPGLLPCPSEIIAPLTQPLLWEGLKRVNTYWPWQWESPASKSGGFWSELAKKVIESGASSLSICHLKKHSRKLFEAIYKFDKTVLHLSASMCPKHRRGVLAEAQRRLKEGLPCRLVATQVIEAGVDIDFPVVFRAMAGLESLTQSAGRCNREGKLAEGGDFFIFTAPEKPPGNLAYNLDTANSMIAGEVAVDLFTPATFTNYFELLYLGKGDGLDAAHIQNDRKELNFQTVSKNFKLIPDLTETVIIPYDQKAIELIIALDEVGPSALLYRELQPYTVSAYPKQLEKLQEAGQLLEHKGLFSLIEGSGNYDQDFGLFVDSDDSLPI